MGIAKKGKRKLIHNEIDYYWWVGDDYEGPTGHEIVSRSNCIVGR